MIRSFYPKTYTLLHGPRVSVGGYVHVNVLLSTECAYFYLLCSGGLSELLDHFRVSAGFYKVNLRPF